MTDENRNVTLAPRHMDLVPFAHLLLCSRADGMPGPNQVLSLLGSLLEARAQPYVAQSAAERISEPVDAADLQMLVAMASKCGPLPDRQRRLGEAVAICRAAEGFDPRGFSDGQRAALASIARLFCPGNAQAALVAAGGPSLDEPGSRDLLSALWRRSKEGSDGESLWPAAKNPFGWLGEAVPIDCIAVEYGARVRIDTAVFLRSLARSISLSGSEKMRIIDTLPKLRQSQVEELIRIFCNEKEKFHALSQQNFPQLLKLELKFAYEWLVLRQMMKQRSSGKEAAA